MKLIACALPLLVGVPSVLSAQIRVGTTLGPIAVVATIGGRGVTVRAIPRGSRHTPAARIPRATTASAARVLATADRYLGTRYRYGGDTPAAGFDCSGFVQYVFARHGVDLPRTSRQISQLGESVSLDRGELREGDLLFFAGNGTRIDHVAIYLGEDRIIHSTASGGGVRVESLTSARGEWFERRLVAARRVVGDGRALVRPLDDEQRPDSLDPPDTAPPPAR
jgi:cell wall-associated NlpC family hydrolase